MGSQPRPVSVSDLSDLRRTQSRRLEVLTTPLQVKQLGLIEYEAAHKIQEQLWTRSGEPWLLLLEHPSVYTQGVRIRPENILVDPKTLDIPIINTNRGGDITYHGPGQLVAYVIVDVEIRKEAIANHVYTLEQIVIDTLVASGLDDAKRLPGFPGVWIDERKIAAVGVRVARGRSMHGFALNVSPDLKNFSAIVPCGLTNKSVTSMAAEGVPATIDFLSKQIITRVANHWTGGDFTISSENRDFVSF
ncbi:MAG: lipoyl(octanoyl) transferase LipB [Acidimicrobiia bacterium]|nr:lipoyl(octanoyl) transferase LipB [Acidimicrobiia bacterium]